MEQLIQWYPGHIAKAQRQLREKIGMVDCVIELVDARLPFSSHFPFVDEIAGHKPRIVVLNKMDLAPENRIRESQAYWREKGYGAVAVNVPQRQGLDELKAALDALHVELTAKMKKRGRLPRKLRTMVMGLPNVGKSSLINALINKRSAKVGNKPGVTKGLLWVVIAKNLELLDTPGVIPPKFEDQDLALKLALIGSISEYAADPEDVAAAGLELLQRDFPGTLGRLYGAEDMTLTSLAEQRGFLHQAGLPDTRRAAESLLLDLRGGRPHRLWLENPPTLDELAPMASDPADAPVNFAPADLKDEIAEIERAELDPDEVEPTA